MYSIIIDKFIDFVFSNNIMFKENINRLKVLNNFKFLKEGLLEG